MSLDTVSEAGSKICPLTFGGIINNCISSQCMMWQWELLPDGGTAKKGFCGLVATLGAKSEQQPKNCYF